MGPMNVTEENKLKLKELGVKIFRGTIPLFGPTFSMRLHLHKTTSIDVIAKTLELMSTATLVCLETVLIATDAGAIPEGTSVLACAVTEMGLDTEWIMRSCASANMFHPFKGFRFRVARQARSYPSSKPKRKIHTITHNRIK
jgi:hypothetical protein